MTEDIDNEVAVEIGRLNEQVRQLTTDKETLTTSLENAERFNQVHLTDLKAKEKQLLERDEHITELARRLDASQKRVEELQQKLETPSDSELRARIEELEIEVARLRGL